MIGSDSVPFLIRFDVLTSQPLHSRINTEQSSLL